MGCCCSSSDDPKKDTIAKNSMFVDGDLLRDVNHFSLKELRAATESFSTINRIGRGGFGTVYKGILKSGKIVAVKTLSVTSKQGRQEFLNEINAVYKVRHPNLVELVGCCVEENSRILVYEFVENSSVDRALLGSRNALPYLTWEKRSAICIGVAKGLAYLHEELVPYIVHRDIKASNILLDENFHAKIGDFGLAKLFPDDITHISTRIAGTRGYLAPEYALGGQLTKKADVYSFGVLILEIVSGRSSGKLIWMETPRILLEWAWQMYEEGKVLELVDRELSEYSEEEIVRFIKVAFFCTQAAPSKRPSMSQVVEMLTRSIKLNDKLLMPPSFLQDYGGEASSRKNMPPECSSSRSSATFTSVEVTAR